ncbi:hypothetical protein JCM6882_004967 [Rhodosporidiobolus microsporus]
MAAGTPDMASHGDSRLPPELWQRILELVPLPQPIHTRAWREGLAVLLPLCTVSKAFNALLQPLLFHTLVLPPAALGTTSSGRPRALVVAQNGRSVRNVLALGDEGVGAWTVSTLVDFPNLEALTLEYFVGPVSLDDLLPFSHLRHLCVYNSSIMPPSAPLSALESLILHDADAPEKLLSTFLDTSYLPTLRTLFITCLIDSSQPHQDGFPPIVFPDLSDAFLGQLDLLQINTDTSTLAHNLYSRPSAPPLLCVVESVDDLPIVRTTPGDKQTLPPHLQYRLLTYQVTRPLEEYVVDDAVEFSKEFRLFMREIGGARSLLLPCVFNPADEEYSTLPPNLEKELAMLRQVCEERGVWIGYFPPEEVANPRQISSVFLRRVREGKVERVGAKLAQEG